jgi:hypothetical protein
MDKSSASIAEEIGKLDNPILPALIQEMPNLAQDAFLGH